MIQSDFKRLTRLILAQATEVYRMTGDDGQPKDVSAEEFVREVAKTDKDLSVKIENWNNATRVMVKHVADRLEHEEPIIAKRR